MASEDAEWESLVGEPEAAKTRLFITTSLTRADIDMAWKRVDGLIPDGEIEGFVRAVWQVMKLSNWDMDHALSQMVPEAT